MELSGKTALVTGAAKRVGREIALELARRGADLIVHYRGSRAEAESAAAEIRALGRRAETFQADLASVPDIERLARALENRAGHLDILVNSASLFFKTPVESAAEKDWDALIDSNLKGPFFLSARLGKKLTASRGTIVNIVDWSALRPYRDYAAYCASKGGLVTLTKSLARELAPHVRVNAVAPGPVMRPPEMDEAEAKTIAGLTALGRWGAPQDVARAVAFLAENDYVNGQILVVDGGRSIV
jgi:pteridine reductase